MMYAPKGTYDMEAMGWEELKAFDPMEGWAEEKVDAYVNRQGRKGIRCSL